MLMRRAFKAFSLNNNSAFFNSFVFFSFIAFPSLLRGPMVLRAYDSNKSSLLSLANEGRRTIDGDEWARATRLTSSK
jgi:hypothetical protein